MRRVALALAVSLVVPGIAHAEKLLGVIPVPGVDDFRAQVIERQPTEAWPFSVDRGRLLCAPSMGRRATFFVTDEPTPRVQIVSVSPLDLWMSRMLDDTVLSLEGDMDALTRAMIPYVEIGRRLCDLDAGTSIGPGET